MGGLFDPGNAGTAHTSGSTIKGLQGRGSECSIMASVGGWKGGDMAKPVVASGCV